MKLHNAKAIAEVSTAFVMVAVMSVISLKPADAGAGNMAHVFSAAVDKQTQGAQAKVLKSPEMGLLDEYLQSAPIGTVRMEFTYKAALKVLEELDKRSAPSQSVADQKAEQAWLKERVNSIINPVKEFFGMVHSMSGMIKPLITESIQNKDSVLLKFFDSPDTATAFFENYAKTPESLRIVCNEFITFFKDIRNSLSQNSVVGARKLIEEIKKNKQSLA